MGRTLAVPACKRMRMGTRTWIRCGEGQIFDDETDYFSINFLPTWTPALGEAHNLTTCSLPIFVDKRCCSTSDAVQFLPRRLPLAFFVAPAPIATASPSAREARFSRRVRPSLVYAAVIRTSTVRNRRRYDQSGWECGIQGPTSSR